MNTHSLNYHEFKKSKNLQCEDKLKTRLKGRHYKNKNKRYDLYKENNVNTYNNVYNLYFFLIFVLYSHST